MHIGLIGTGIMGSAIARRLLSKGYELTVYNRTRAKAEALKIFNAKVVDTPKEVAKCELIITVLKDAKVLEDICFSNGMLDSKFTLADVSTINPIDSRRIANRLREYGINMLDTPVMGGPQLAENGELIVMASGKKDIFDRYIHVFETIGKKIFYLGDNGSAATMKLAMNLQIAMLALSLSEGIALVKGAKLDPAIFLEILNSTYFKTGMSERKGPKMIKHNFEKSFALSMMRKDLHEINFTTKELGLSLPLASIAENIYLAADNLGYGELDYTGILAFIEKINKLENE